MKLSLTWNEIKRVLEAPSIPNYEGAVYEVIKETLGKSANARIVNDMTLVELNPKAKPFILIGAHSDVLGGRVTDISEDGFIYFALTGGSHAGWLIGQQVKIHTELSGGGEVCGVIGHKAVHHLEPEERNKVPKVNEIFIDIGAKTKKEVRDMGIEIGDPVIYSIGAEKLALNDRIVARGWDNRAGVLTLIEVIRRVKEEDIKAHVVFAFWGGEEVGLIGGFRGSALYKPEVMINVDVGFATKTPSTGKEKAMHGDVDLGGGVIINRGGVFDPSLVKKSFELAKSKKIKTQFSVITHEGGTDATPFNRSGARVLDLGLPCRYMHYDEVVDLKDIESAASLIVELLKTF